MARLELVNPDHATGKAAELLTAVKSKMTMVPNMTRAMANAPAVLEAYLGISGALGRGRLSPKLREKIALVSAQANECDYCLAAHTAIGKSVGLTEESMQACRRGEECDGSDAAAIRLARSILENRGAVSDADLATARGAGLSDADIAEVVGHVVLNIFTNYFNRLADTDIDFPKVAR